MTEKVSGAEPDSRIAAATAALNRVLGGEVPANLETEILDFKEDPTRRDRRGRRTPGAQRDDKAARYFAAEAACFANHEGGAILIGLDDKASGQAAVVGTQLDAGWLRNRIRELTSPPITVGMYEIEASHPRVVVLTVPRNGGAEPHSAIVSRSGGRRTPRRVADNCHDMTSLAEMLGWAQERSSYDWSASPSGRPLADARASAVDALRDFLRESGEPDRARLADLDDGDLLRRLQLLRDDGTLTRGGALFICPGPAPRIEYLHRPAAGTSSTTRVADGRRGLVEELRRVLETIAVADRTITLPAGVTGVRGTVRAVPIEAVREALINAVMHRDWDIPEPITIEHTGDEITVVSPGDLFGGVTVETMLTAPSRTRNRLLGNALRSLRLAEREGTGIDRMFIEMIRLGHRPPDFTQRDGGMRVVLTGGEPMPEVLRAHSSLPTPFRDSARTAVALDILRRQPSFSLEDLCQASQEGASELEAFLAAAVAEGVLRRTTNPRADGVPAWRLEDALRETLGPVLPYYARPAAESVRLIGELARQQGVVRNQDVQDLLGLQPTRASQLLSRAEREMVIKLAPGAKRVGRGAAYVSNE